MKTKKYNFFATVVLQKALAVEIFFFLKTEKVVLWPQEATGITAMA